MFFIVFGLAAAIFVILLLVDKVRHVTKERDKVIKIAEDALKLVDDYRDLTKASQDTAGNAIAGWKEANKELGKVDPRPIIDSY